MSALAQGLYLGVLGVLGLAFGSFGNVVIWRFPRGESLSSPPSHCPKCDHAIRWFDNVPVLGWLALRGRCRDCGEPISVRYPLVEAASGALWVLAGYLYGFTPRALAAVVLFYLLLILALIDLDTMRLPNPLVALLAIVGAVFVLVGEFTSLQGAPLLRAADRAGAGSLLDAMLGLVLGAGLSLLIALAYSAVRKASGFGMGDVKLLGALGIYLGPYVLMTLFFGSLLGAVAGIALGAASDESVRTRKLPFGPMLALGALVTVITGPAVWSWYAGAAGLR